MKPEYRQSTEFDKLEFVALFDKETGAEIRWYADGRVVVHKTRFDHEPTLIFDWREGH